VAPLLPVQSSMFSHIGYDPATNVMAVRYKKSNYVHHFKDVPQAEFDAVRTAPSIGQAFNARIKDRYDHTVVEVDAEDEVQQPADAEA